MANHHDVPLPLARPPRRWTMRRARALMRSRGPTSLLFRRRIAVVTGAIAIGIVAVLFAGIADTAGAAFARYAEAWRWAPLATTPITFVVLVWLTRRFAPAARGSGIPQVMAAREQADFGVGSLIAMRTAVAKIGLTIGAILSGASVGREGPTVQLAAAIMAQVHRVFRVPMRASVVIASGAAGVAAAFNTPLAGILFAIEELAAAYEQRVTLLVLSLIVVAGIVAQSLSGDYVYFGVVHATLPLGSALVVVPVAGLVGGLAGGLFARLMMAVASPRHAITGVARRRPLAMAGGCGIVVAALGIGTHGLTWGTGYGAAQAMLSGVDAPLWFGPAKFVAALSTAVAGLPGGIFAPSLAVGAGVGNLLRLPFADEPARAVVMLGMVAYFTGVVRAPLTAVVILAETTGSRGLMLPMFATAFIADWASTRVSADKLYHSLSRGFVPHADPVTGSGSSAPLA
ncbi:H+/Cl- antiporter ClcA [Sphingomonas jinjuensis]|uniref:H+/Cl- antiporter ClcA n=1 Tax=Sphingomonas jinjuensis TaxID=535907 RepID=A0A840FEC0_9SPHN|nr:chloride channel protein [Sphingomonas jinjuensis]MBB4154084.1 H+/Cl- antiporter ClcA [Sphingomonas jinjuensis]